MRVHKRVIFTILQLQFINFTCFMFSCFITHYTLPGTQYPVPVCIVEFFLYIFFIVYPRFSRWHLFVLLCCIIVQNVMLLSTRSIYLFVFFHELFFCFVFIFIYSFSFIHFHFFVAFHFQTASLGNTAATFNASNI